MKTSILIFLMIFCFAKSVICQEAKSKGKLSVTVFWKQATPKDTLYLIINNPVNRKKNLNEIKACLKGGKYSFTADVSDTSGIFYIQKRRTHTNIGGVSQFDFLTKAQNWVAGDSLVFTFSHYAEGGNGSTGAQYTVSGRGATKYNLAKTIDSILIHSFDVEPVDCNQHQTIFNNPFTRQQAAAMQYLTDYKGKLTSQEYAALKANIDYFNGNLLFRRIADCYTGTPDQEKRRFIALYKERINDLVPRPIKGSDLLNTNYIDFLMYKYANESKIINHGSLDISWLYDEIVRNEFGPVRDRLVAKLFYRYRKPNNFKTILTDAMAIVKEHYSRELVMDYYSQLTGAELKDFALLDTNDQLVNISKFRGKVVVLDFWTVGCGACSALYQNVIRKIKLKLGDQNNIVFISINADSRKQRWIKGIDSGMFTDKDAINLNTGPQNMNHPAFTSNSITAVPTAILLDRDGKIVRFNTAELYTLDGMLLAINEAIEKK
ncbi:TlpA disulfide reductase family protein [Sphingobacterium sp. UME9]|uniref:TlpA family protein disulfide reductase n=1 Tax=Sphingobacterium TaxID=28453 RepID=UPI001601C3AE|nr:TlpA disulfide reductase family protein [Sphingobacterium sp. UME9]